MLRLRGAVLACMRLTEQRKRWARAWRKQWVATRNSSPARARRLPLRNAAAGATGGWQRREQLNAKQRVREEWIH